MIVPHENDVLLGRGVVTNSNPGNLRYRNLVTSFKQDYLACEKKKDKRAIAMKIVDMIADLDPPGRFIQSGKDGEWVCVEKEKAVEKVLHRLREKEKGEKENSASKDSSRGGGADVKANKKSFRTKLDNKSSDISANSNEGARREEASQNLKSESPLATAFEASAINSDPSTLSPHVDVTIYAAQLTSQTGHSAAEMLSHHSPPSQLIDVKIYSTQSTPENGNQMHVSDDFKHPVKGIAFDTSLAPNATILTNSKPIRNSWEDSGVRREMKVDEFVPQNVDNTFPVSDKETLDFISRHFNHAVLDCDDMEINPSDQDENSDNNGNQKEGLSMREDSSEEILDFFSKHFDSDSYLACEENKFEDLSGQLQRSTNNLLTLEPLPFKPPTLYGDVGDLLSSVIVGQSSKISLHSWVTLAAQWLGSTGGEAYRQSYIPRAIELAHNLATHLAMLTAQKSDLGEVLGSKDVDLSVTVQCSASLLGGQAFFDDHTIDGVSFSVTPARVTESGGSGDGNGYNAFRSACQVFHEIFSLGRRFPAQGSETRQLDRDCFSDGGMDNSSVSNTLCRQLTIDSNDSCQKKARMKEGRDTFIELQMYGVPASLCRLLADLMRRSKDSLALDGLTMDDVVSTLCQMKNDPVRFLYDSVNTRSGSMENLHQHLQTSFHGRKKEISVLSEAAMRVYSSFSVDGPFSTTEVSFSRCEVVFVKGVSGYGKSTLVSHFLAEFDQHRRLHQRNTKQVSSDGYFECGWSCSIQCKFDSLQHGKPFSAIASAFDQYFASLLNQLDHQSIECLQTKHKVLADFLETFVKDIECKVGQSGVNTLCDMIPSFLSIYSVYSTSKLIPRRSSYEQMNSVSDVGFGCAITKLHSVLGKFLSSISATANCPIILVMDDLQWADGESLGLLRSMTCEFDSFAFDGNDNRGLFVIGCYRENEVSPPHSFLTFKENIAADGVAHVSDVEVGQLERLDVQNMISEALSLPHHTVRQLANVLFIKTLGNPLLLKQFVEMLGKSGHLQFSPSENRWVWDEERIQAIPMSSDREMNAAVNLFSIELRKLPVKVRAALKILSCFGSSISLEVLNLLRNEDLSPSLDIAVREGFLIKVSDTYKYQHDAIQQASYSLIQAHQRDTFHLTLAQTLLGRAIKAGNVDSFVFLIADQAKQMDLSKIEGKERAIFVDIFSKAAKDSAKLLHFNSTLSYISSCLALMDNLWSDKNYSLTIKLLGLSAYSNFVEGNLDAMNRDLDSIFSNAKSYDHQLDAQLILMISLGMSGGNLQKAYSCSISVLEHLGETFPEPTEAVIKISMFKTMAALKGVNKSHFQSMLPMVDKRKLVAMKFLKHSINVTQRMQSKVQILLACRMVDLTMKFGMAKESAFGIVRFGSYIANVAKNIQAGFGLGKLAMSMLDNPITEGDRGSVCLAFYATLACNCEPKQAVFDPLMKAYNDNLMSGNLNFSSKTALAYCSQRSFSGHQLDALCREFIHFIREMMRYNQLDTIRQLMVQYCSIVDLIELQQDPLSYLSQGDYSISSMTNYAKSNGDVGLLMAIYFSQLFNASIVGDMKSVEASMLCIEGFPVVHNIMAVDPSFAFVEGACLFRLARETGNTKWIQMAMKCKEALIQWANICEWNWANKSLLVQAEMQYCNKNYQEAAKLYSASIDAAKRSRFVHQEGFAHEFWAIMCRETGDMVPFEYHMREACRCYEEWGAKSKVKHVHNQLAAAGVFIGATMSS